MITGGVDRLLTGCCFLERQVGFPREAGCVGELPAVMVGADYFSEFVTGDEPLKTLMIGRSISGDSEW